MNKIKIVTDSSADLSSELISQYDITVVPLYVTLNGETYRDRVDITPEAFIDKMKGSDKLPTSSQPAAGEFLELYDRLGSQGYEVLSIHISGNLSGTIHSAETAASMSSANVTVVDSRYISKALGFQVIAAAALAKEGKPMADIVSHLHAIRMRTKLYVLVDTLENLAKGGRIGKGTALLGSLLHIKPIASLENGEYTPIAKVRSHAHAVKYLAKQFADDVKDKVIQKIGIVHAEGHELAAKMKQAIQALADCDDIQIEPTTPVISMHTGIGAIGLMYYCD